MSQRQDRGPPSRLRRISFLPTSLTSASLSHKAQHPSSSFAPPTSSPARNHPPPSKKPAAVSTQGAIRRRTSCSTLPISSSTQSATVGQRRVNASPLDKRRLASDDKPTAAPVAVSEFGAFHKVASQITTVASPRSTSIHPRHTVSGQASALPNSSIRQTTLPTARSSLRPSTAGGKPQSGESFPLKSSLSSSIPRPRVGSSTPTRALMARHGGHVKATASVTIPSKSPSSQLKPTASRSSTTLTSSKSSFSVKSRAAVWERVSESCSSPSPSPRQKSTPQSTPTAKTMREARPADACDERAAGKSQAQPQPLPDRSRRSSIMLQKAVAPQLKTMRSRRSSLIPLRPSASANVAVTASSQLGIDSSKARLAGNGEEDLWGRWKAGTPAQCDDRGAENRTDGRETYDEDSRDSLCANDFINASMLLDEKMLDELDAEVGRLGLDESTTAVEHALEDLKLEQQKKEDGQREEEIKQREMLFDAMTKQRDEATYREMQAEKELQAARDELEGYKAAAEEAEVQRQRRREMATQTLKSEEVVEPVAADVRLQQLAESAQLALTGLTLESLCQEWKHATDLAYSHVTLLESQSQICSYFLAQLNMFRLSIEKVQCNDE